MSWASGREVSNPHLIVTSSSESSPHPQNHLVTDTILLDRPIERCVGGDTFSGAYLDNGLGCFVAAEVARKVAADPKLTEHVRCLFAFASHEEIGRFGSRVLAQELRPDVLIAVDVNHDYDTAPDVGKERYQPLKMGEGMTMCVGE